MARLCKCHGEPMLPSGNSPNGRKKWECRVRKYARQAKYPQLTEARRVMRRRHHKRHGQEVRKFLKGLRGQGCVDCGTKKGVLQFHHRDPDTKEFNIGTGSGSYSWSKLKAELAKCDLLCGTCHLEAHRLLDS